MSLILLNVGLIAFLPYTYMYVIPEGNVWSQLVVESSSSCPSVRLSPFVQLAVSLRATPTRIYC